MTAAEARQSHIMHPAPRGMAGGRQLRELVRSRVLLLHPEDADAAAFVRLLGKIGCQARQMWPPPRLAPADADLLVVLIGARAPLPSWLDTGLPMPVVGIVEQETPAALASLVASSACGVLGRPLARPGAVSTLLTALSTGRYIKRLHGKIAKLEDTLQTRREIERATRAVMDMRKLSENDAYQFIRRQATEKRVPMSTVARSILDAAAFLQLPADAQSMDV